MTGRRHTYALTLAWRGDRGSGTSTYGGYGRQHLISAPPKEPILGSADPAFRGDRSLWNPEELLVAALSACHQLSYLALCARSGVCVTAYSDAAEGVMEEVGEGGRFVSVTLKPKVTVAAEEDLALALRLHRTAHEACFIAASVNFPILCVPEVAYARQA